MLLPESSDTAPTGRHIRVESFLAGAFIATVSVWCVSALLTLVGIIIGGGTLPPRTMFLTAVFIYDFARLPVVAALVVAGGAIRLLKARPYSMRHRYAIIWIFATAYVVVSALLAYGRALFEGAGTAAPLAAAVFLSWGALIAYGYAALVAGALAIAEKFSIVSPPRTQVPS